MATANWQVVPHTPWNPIDSKVLAILSTYKVKTKDMAEIFFEGRTVEECENMLESLNTGILGLRSELNEPSRRRVQKVDFSSPVKHESTEVGSTGPFNTTSSSTMVPHPMSPVGPRPIQTPRIQTSVNSYPPNSTEMRTGRSETPYADSQKAWEQADRDIVWKAIKDHMSARDIQKIYLPFRSESAIATRMCKERRIREGQAAPLKWSPDDGDRSARPRDEQYSSKHPARNFPSEQAPYQFQLRYDTSRDHVDVVDADMNTNMLGRDIETEFDHQMIQESADRDDDSDYVDEKPTQKRPGIARKTPASAKDTSKKSPSSISSLRNKLLNAIDAYYLPDHKKEALRKALRKNWPTHFASVESRNTPLPAKGSRWSEKDTRALKIIHEIVPDLPHKYIKEFFPGRNEASISRQINSRLKSGEWGA